MNRISISAAVVTTVVAIVSLSSSSNAFAQETPDARTCSAEEGQRIRASGKLKEAGTFYLTDFLARHFDRLVIKGLGIDRHPELLPLYFGNYKRVVYLAQRSRPA